MMASPADPEKYDAILDAALVLFADRGFHGTIVPDIAARAGVGAGTIYRYFANKEAIVNAVYRRWKGEFAGLLAANLASSDSPQAAFTRFIEGAFDFAMANPVAVRFLETHHHQAYLDAESHAAGDRALAPALRFFEETSAAGLTRAAPPEILCGVVWGGLIGVLRMVWEGGATADSAVRADIARILWDAVRAPSP